MIVLSEDSVGGSVSGRLFNIGPCLPSGNALSENDLNLICMIIQSVGK
ncbi:MAG: hypothetical protein HQ568_04665 [Calditrichaeota bacterium]|nr:hypothetical protein [Calditrichota bacterium]